MRSGVALAAAVALLSGTVPTHAAAPRRDCAALTGLALPGTTITEARPIAADATTDVPAHCRVRARVNERVGTDGVTYAIVFELRLPDRWNRRFFFQGGAGTDGIVYPALGPVQGLGGSSGIMGAALTRGFAVAATDSGHRSFDQAFGFDAQARADYGYNAVDVTTRRSKDVIAHYYGRPVKRSYLVGCSNGGRQAMIASQRFPEHFDGVVAGNPAFDLSRVLIAGAWDTQALVAIAPRDPGGQPILSQAFSDADLDVVATAVLAACDELDGLADGIIDAYSACRFDPAVLVCPGAKTPSCLSAEQVGALQRLFDGPRDSHGTPLYAPWPWDAGIGDEGFRQWKLGASPTATPDALNTTLVFSILRYLYLTPPDPGFDPLAFDFDSDPARVFAGAPTIDATSTDLAAFRRRRGKLILYNGLSDAVFSSHDLIAYYERLATAQGGLRETQRFARLFLVPGMGHCNSGPTLDVFDPLTPLVAWVEKGRAPSRLIATGRAFPGRSRPLCPYPQETRYRGRGDPEKAASFRCVTPRR
jgi:feruloyl esterase